MVPVEGTGSVAARLGPAAPRSTAGLVALVVTVVCCLALVGTALGWRVSGGRWAVVETPSMGTAVPVGSLVLIQPRPVETLRNGDIVTYRPPSQSRMYTHRVVGRDDHGVRVQGDVNGTPDPYAVTSQDLVGLVVAHWRGVGHLVRALPFLLLAELVLLLGSRTLVRAHWRSTVRVLGTCLTVTLCVLVLRPFVRPVLMATTPSGDEVLTTVVSGGMFPTRVTGGAGQHVDLLSGEVGSVLTRPEKAGGPAMITGSPHLTGWWLVLVVVVCLLPLAWCLLVGLAPDEAEAASTPGEETAPAADPVPAAA